MNLGISPLSFLGTVKMNKEKIAKEIAKIEPGHSPRRQQEQIDSLVGNVNTLKERLEGQTPDDCQYNLDIQLERRNWYDPYKHNPIPDTLVVDLIDETHNRKYASNMELASISDVRIDYADGETIWKDGFKKITEKALSEANKSDDELNAEREYKETRDRMSSRENGIFDRLG